MNIYTPETFLQATPQENLDFIKYCARRGWVKFPFDAWSIWARDFMKRCIRQGWVKPPKSPERESVTRSKPGEPERICKGRYIRHRWGYADLCERCGTQFIGKKHAPSKRPELNHRGTEPQRGESRF